MMEDQNLSDGLYSYEDSSEQNDHKVQDIDGLRMIEDMDEYWDDINIRLTISRMVSDSVFRGMVKAFEQEAAERINIKELEVAKLKSCLNHYRTGVDEPDMICYGSGMSSLDTYEDCLKIKNSLGSLQNTTKMQLKLLEEVKSIKQFNHFSQKSCSLNGGLNTDMSDGWRNVCSMVDSVMKMVDALLGKMKLSKGLHSLKLQEHVFQAEVEQMVFADCIRSTKVEFDQKLLAAQSMRDESLNWLEGMEEILSLRKEVDLILKALHGHETGHSSSEEQNHRRSDNIYCRLSGNLIPSTSLLEVNGKHDEPAVSVENFDISHMKNMKKDEMFNHMMDEMSRIKRECDYKVQDLTEMNFSLKRENLNLREKVSSSPLKRDKEFETLRKKVSDFISKLDNFLLENCDLHSSDGSENHPNSVKKKLDSLVSNNCQLKEILTEKEREVDCRHSKTCDASRRISDLLQSKEVLLEKIRSLQSVFEDSRIEASISEDVYACSLRDLVEQLKFVNEESQLEHHKTQQIYELYAKSDIALQLTWALFREALSETEHKLSDLSNKYISESEIRASYEISLHERSNALELEIDKNKRLDQDVLLLRDLSEENKKQVLKAESTLAKETERLDMAFKELSNLRTIASKQARAMLQSTERLRCLELELDGLHEQKNFWKTESNKLRLNLEETNVEKTRVLALAKEKEWELSMVEARDFEQRKKMALLLFDGFITAFTKFECQIEESIKRNGTRFKSLRSQLHSLNDGVAMLKKRGAMYKQRFEKRSAELLKAEAEVDLLGDDVDSLLSLLEKIYIALDHYSPVLKHYPGIIEILKLVRRELSGEDRRLLRYCQ